MARANADIATALDVYDFSLSADDVRHVRARHGDARTEALRGQIAIELDDYRLLPCILSSPDTIADAGKSGLGEPLIRYEKVIGGVRFVAVMAVRRKRGTLGLKTFYARPAK